MLEPTWCHFVPMWALADQFGTNLRCIIGDIIALLCIALHLHSASFTHLGDPACEHLFVLHCIALPCILHAWHCIACPGSAAQAVRPLQYMLSHRATPCHRKLPGHHVARAMAAFVFYVSCLYIPAAIGLKSACRCQGPGRVLHRPAGGLIVEALRPVPPIRIA